MRCKACGRVVPDGSVRCPHCGAYISRGGRPGEEFKWNIQEYPKPKGREPADVSVDWQGGLLVDNESGRTYDQHSGSGWKEPEEVKFLFTFEPENEELQKEVDQQVDILVERAPKEPPVAEVRQDLFSLPSQMDMKEYDSLLEDDDPAPPPRNTGWINDYLSTNFDGTPIQSVQSGEEPVYRKAPTAAEFIFGTGVKKEEPLLNWDLSKRPSAVQKNANAAAAASAAARQQAQQAAAAAAAKKEKVVPPPERAANGKYSVPKMMQEQQYDPFETRKTWGSMHMPDFLRGGDRLLFTSGPDIYEEVQEAASRELGPSAGYKADMEELRAQETFKRLIDVEERFTEDMDRVVFMSEEEKELEEKAERRREELIDVPRIDFLSIEDEYDRYREVNGIPRAETIEEVLGTLETAGTAEEADAEAAAVPEETPREVNIRINSPSGTQYTVKTQEIHMNTEDAEGGSEAAKAVQVSVEVNGTGSGSVEVTSGPDGATRVTATEEGQEAVSAAEVLAAAEPEDDVPFWEKKPVTRMTITDIFGPEAREILEAGTGEPEDGEAENLISTMDVAEAAEAAAEEVAETEEAVEEAAPEVAEEAAETEGAVEEAAPEAAEEAAEAEDAVEEAAPEAAEEAAETEEAVEEAAPEVAEEVTEAEEAVEEAAPEAAEEAAEAEETVGEAAPEAAEEAAEAGEAVEEAAPEAAEEAGEAEEVVEEVAAEAAEEPAEAAAATEKTLAEAIAEAAEEEEPAEEDFVYYEEPEVQEFTYSVNEERLTKEEIRNMSQEELDAAAAEAAAREAARKAEIEEEKKKAAAAAAAVAAAAEGVKSSDKAAETKASADKPEEAKKSKEEEEKPAKKKLFGKKEPSDKAAKEEEKAAKAEAKARKKAAKAAAAKAAKDEDEPMSLKIMRIVIIVLIVAVLLEFLIFGIRLLAPDSMLGIIFNKLGSGFSGADSLFGSGIFRM